ncbi:MAG: LysE family transporter [Eubacteriales bacterium]
MAAIFLKSILIGYSGAVMPGSLLAYVINQSLKKGIKTGYLAIAGHIVLEIALIVLIFLGLNQILSSTIAAIVISVLGGILLLFFGISGVLEIIKNKVGVNIDQEAKENSDGRIVADGLLLSFTNPYFIIWWATIGMVLLYEAFNLFGYIGVIIFAIGHFIADLSWYMFVSGLVAKSKGFLPEKAYRTVAFVLSLALVGFGIKYLINGIQIIFQL